MTSLTIAIAREQDQDITALDWHQWLSSNLLAGQDYQLLYWEDRVDVEFFNPAAHDDFVACNSL
jgi:hypothetical protein